MKKLLCFVICAIMVFSLTACATTTPTATEWSRSGYFQDENGNFLSITCMEDVEEPGWYVGCMLGEDLMADSWGGTLSQDGNKLSGTLASSVGGDDLTVTVTEEGDDGVVLTVEGGETYHFTPYDIPEATIFVTINTEGFGMIGYEEGETTPELDPERPYQSAQVNLAEPATYTFAAAPEAGSLFVKWTKNGEDYSTEAVITVLLDESADFVAVFEDDPDWQNPVMNFVGEYQCDRAHAAVETFGRSEAWITIEWSGSATEQARWDIVGAPDAETMTIEYSGVAKYINTFAENGEIISQEAEYEDGTGTIVFNEDGTLTWHEDQSETGTDMVFEPVPGRQDGERFEAVIMLEGMEETVQYEHVVNEALGFEMDYDYENFTRQSGSDRERFISIWDDEDDPENYLEVTYSEDDAETAAEAIKEELSQEYDLIEETRELDNAGSCIYIEASVSKGTNTMPDQLQVVYIIPASDGCRIAAAHFSFESAEGFGRRFAYMMQTFSAI